MARFYARPTFTSGGGGGTTIINLTVTNSEYVAFPFLPAQETSPANPIQNQAYFDYVGYWPMGEVFNYVVMNLIVPGGQQATEVGFFSSPVAPNRTAQILTRIASTPTLESMTVGAGVKRNVFAMNATLVTATFLWTGYRHSGALAQPTFSGLNINGDLGDAATLILNSAPAFSATTGFVTALNAGASRLYLRAERFPIV